MTVTSIPDHLRRDLLCDPDLAALAQRVSELREHCIELDYMVARALGAPATTRFLTSLEATIALIQARYPKGEYSFGCSLAPDGRIRAWISSEFAIARPDLDYRYYECVADTIELAFLAALLHAESYRHAETDRLAA